MKKSTITKDTDVKEFRRKLIVRLSKRTNLNQTEISEILECSQGYVSQILGAYAGGGETESGPGRHRGAQSGLAPRSLKTLKSLLDKGAKEQGFDNDL